jgi:hypothetical protein
MKAKRKKKTEKFIFLRFAQRTSESEENEMTSQFFNEGKMRKY